MTRVALSFALVLCALSIASFACAAAPDSLYARLGGEAGVARIVNDTIDRVVKDPRTGRSFKDSNLTRVKKHLAQQICELGDGGCPYEGDPMREVHAGHDISEAEFYGLVEILREVLREQDVRTADRNALLALLAPMKRDVVRVEPPGAPPARSSTSAAGEAQ